MPIIECLVKSGDVDGAKAVIVRTQEGSEKSLLAVAEIMAKSGYLETTRVLFDEALEKARESGIQDIDFDIQISIAESMARVGESERSNALFDQILKEARTIDDEDDGARALRSIARRLVRAGDVKSAKRVFRQALKRAWNLEDGYEKSSILSTIAEGLAISGDVDLALKTVEKVKNAPWTSCVFKSVALSKIAVVVAETGSADKALEVAGRIIQLDHKCEAIQSIAAILAKTGQEERAREVFAYALEIAKECDDSLVCKTLRSIAISLLESGDVKGAMETVEDIDDAGDRSSAMLSIAESLADFGDMERSRIMFDQAVDTASKNSRLLCAIAETMGMVGDVARALKLVESIEDARHKSRALSSLAKSISGTSSDDIFVDYLQDASLSSECWNGILPSWRSGLVEKSTSPFSLLRQSMRYYPFDSPLAYDGVRSLHLAHLKSGNRAAFDAIIHQCPQLELNFLLSSDGKSYSYEAMVEWIGSIQDEEKKSEIQGLAGRVKRGKMSAEEFESEVKEILGGSGLAA